MNSIIEITKSHNCSLTGEADITTNGKIQNNGEIIDLKKELLGIDIIEKGQGKTIGKAAAGAGLGFLLAGPFGTAVGAAIAGSKEGKDTLLLSLTKQRALLVTCDKQVTNTILLFGSKQTQLNNNDSFLTDAESKECPDCAELIKIKAKVCRYCGYRFTEEEMLESIKAAEKATFSPKVEDLYDVVNTKGSAGTANKVGAIKGMHNLIGDDFKHFQEYGLHYRKWLIETPNAPIISGVQKKVAEDLVEQMQLIKFDIVKQGTINYPVYEGSKSGGGCFVATAVYEDSTHPDVIVLRTFRDEVLSSSSYGKKFIEWYYNNGPRYAAYISSKLFIKKLLRLYVFPVIIFIISTIKK